MQIETEGDGIVWARWIDKEAKPIPKRPPGTTAAPGGSCASCNAQDKPWRTVADPAVMPHGELMYECSVCGNTTREGPYERGKVPPMSHAVE
ncbi:MAG: hypothetical protein HY271_11100 [Deltaproteobacteria bacterium]|nr:hypothetical protein [Deltaproteobacteria bacterium]